MVRRIPPAEWYVLEFQSKITGQLRRYEGYVTMKGDTWEIQTGAGLRLQVDNEGRVYLLHPPHDHHSTHIAFVGKMMSFRPGNKKIVFWPHDRGPKDRH